jgi:hypothetical protein
MTKHKLLLDETLDFNKSEQYKMSILISKSGLSFVILDERAKKIIAHKYQEIEAFSNVKEYGFFINKIFNTDEFLKYKYKNLSIIYQSFKSITIPQNLYVEEYKEKFFELNLGINNNEIILTNYLTRMGAVKLFAIPQTVYEAIDNLSQKVKIYHQSTAIIQSALKNKFLETVYINLNLDFFDIQIFDKKNLILDNSFKYKTKEDLLYYLLYTFEQLGLDAKNQKIILFADFYIEESLIAFIQKYSGGIVLSRFPKAFSYSYLFLKKNSHRLATQILTLECE